MDDVKVNPTLRDYTMDFTDTASNPHLLQYPGRDMEEEFRRYDMNADDFMFGLNKHGEARDCYATRDGYATNFMGVRTTFGQLDVEVERVARALYGYGIRQGDFVSFAMPNLKESIVYFYACFRIGAIANLCDPRTHGGGILERVKRTNSRLLITVFNICEPKIDDILDELPCENVILVSPSDSLKIGLKLVPTLGKIMYDVKKKKFEKQKFGPGCKYMWHTDFIKNYTHADDIRPGYHSNLVAAVPYTSGTGSDGVIKGCMITHRAFNAAPCAFKPAMRRQDWPAGATFGGFIPFFSAYGALSGMHTALCGGMEIILVPIFETTKFAEMLLKYKPNVFLGVPRFHEQLAEYPKLQKKSKRLSFVILPIAGGDKFSPASLERVNETYKRNGYSGGVQIGYGSTELGGSIAVMPHYEPGDTDFPWQEEGNVGILLPSCRALAIDPDTEEILPFGVDGELCVHSFSQMERYLDMPEATGEITFYGPDGTKYYRMGDKGHIGENGCIYFTDRYKRSIMRPDGHTVHPSPIENVIMEHEAVEICAVVGLRRPSGIAGTIPSAFVVLREGYGTEEAKKEVLLDIDRLCLRKLPERDRAIAYRAVDEVPYTPMGKIHFRELEKEMFEPGNFLLTDLAFFPELK